MLLWLYKPLRRIKDINDMSRCRCCNKKLTSVELLSSTYVTDDNGKRIKINKPDDFCFNCRVSSANEGSIFDKDYQFDDLSSGITSPHGFSDNY